MSVEEYRLGLTLYNVMAKLGRVREGEPLRENELLSIAGRWLDEQDAVVPSSFENGRRMNPTERYGEVDERTTASLCHDCGALVGSRLLHDMWHDLVIGSPPSAATAPEDVTALHIAARKVVNLWAKATPVDGPTAKALREAVEQYEVYPSQSCTCSGNQNGGCHAMNCPAYDKAGAADD